MPRIRAGSSILNIWGRNANRWPIIDERSFHIDLVKNVHRYGGVSLPVMKQLSVRETLQIVSVFGEVASIVWISSTMKIRIWCNPLRACLAFSPCTSHNKVRSRQMQIQQNGGGLATIPGMHACAPATESCDIPARGAALPKADFRF